MIKQSSSDAPTLLWFRQDLRLQDNSALRAAMEAHRPLLAVYILDDEGEGVWVPGAASRWWLHHALADLDAQLKKAGGTLILRKGESLKVLRQLVEQTGAKGVYWNRRYEPHIVERDKEIKAALRSGDLEIKSFNSALLHEPHQIKKKDGTPFKVFTPYWKHCLKKPKEDPVKIDLKKVEFTFSGIRSDRLDDWNLLPDLDWDSGFYDAWEPTSAGGRQLLSKCVSDKLSVYHTSRDILDKDATSKLSPYLHFGQIGPRQIWAAMTDSQAVGKGRFLAEIGWREFSFHLLYHYPQTPLKPLRPEFQDFPWEKDAQLLEVWQKGQTGFPVVDAGMRQLWQTGWMHNRARMITASFLVKHLLQPWRTGAHWYWDTLVDADLASNTQGWQWTAGCGADASPYFRVFNPILQGRKFDGEGDYVRRWVPELAKLPNRCIHTPWEADQSDLQAAGVVLGENYPHPVIGHTEGRNRALKAYEFFKASTNK